MAFPVNNYGSLVRGFTSVSGQTTSPVLSIPRPKYTYFTVFEFEPTVDAAQFNEAFRTGRVLASIQSISHPQIAMTTETLRSYNAVRNVPVKIDYQPATLTFYDDSTGIVANFLRLYRSFYHYSGDAASVGDYGDGLGMNGRSSSSLPSIGMKTRADGRHFFRRISVYDLGTSPSNINIYHFVNPIITDVSHDELSYYDATGFVNVSLTLQYEGYYEELNENRVDHRWIFDQLQDSGRTLSALQPDANLDESQFFGGPGERNDSIRGFTDETYTPGLSNKIGSALSTQDRIDLVNVADGGVTNSVPAASPIAALRSIVNRTETNIERAIATEGSSLSLTDVIRDTSGSESHINHTATASNPVRGVASRVNGSTRQAEDLIRTLVNANWDLGGGGFG